METGPRAGVVIVPCTNRKRHVAIGDLRAVSLPFSKQADAETAWVARVSGVRGATPAGDLYTGRGAHLGRRAAALAQARLFFVSAGLGLVGSSTHVPSYALTVADRGVDAIASRVEGRFDPAAWWSAVCRSPGSSSLFDVMRTSDGFCLVALTRPYAALLSADLEALPDEDKGRLRLFGWRLEDHLPPSLQPAVMPYDARLDAALPGTQNDFPQRALAHFLSSGALLAGDGLEAHREAVRARMAELVAPRREVRPKATDGEILAWIVGRLPMMRGVQRLLRRIRDEGIACEQARFSRLYRQAMEKLAA